jgi:hypothetical protein
MIIQGTVAAAAYAPSKVATNKPTQSGFSSSTSSDINNTGTKLSISDQAKTMAASDAQDIQKRLDAIKTKPAAERTPEESDFVLKNDSRLAQIAAKGQNTLTADDVDYMQKAGGFVNTMSNLSPSEKNLYDELVAKGNTEAVRGMNLIALSRMGSGDVTLPNGKTFDPRKTEITSENIRTLFSKMFVSSDGQAARSFETLASYLDGKNQSTAS